jgi:holo-[acyl-carrier protein] synthase
MPAPRSPVATLVGIDLADVADVEHAIGIGADRYLRRVYTDRELTECRDDPRRLAACFAAKEATIKVLGPSDEPVPWASIGVRQPAPGHYELELTVRAQTLATGRGITSLAVSIASLPRCALAIVLAVVAENARPG